MVFLLRIDSELVIVILALKAFSAYIPSEFSRFLPVKQENE
jgi:hypothetical protein